MQWCFIDKEAKATIYNDLANNQGRVCSKIHSKSRAEASQRPVGLAPSCTGRDGHHLCQPAWRALSVPLVRATKFL